MFARRRRIRDAQDREAVSVLRLALTEAKVLFTDTLDFTAITPEMLNDDSEHLTYQTLPSTGPHVVSITAPNPNAWMGEVLSRSGRRLYVRHTEDHSVTYGELKPTIGP